MAKRFPCRFALAAAALLLAGAAAAAPAIPPPAPSAGNAPARPAQDGAAPPAPRFIPVEHVFRAAEELEEPLRSAEAAARPDPAVEEVGARLEAAAAAIGELRPDLAPDRLRDASARELDRLRQAIAREDRTLTEAQSALDRRADALAAATRDVQERLASWRATGEAARRQRAPDAVLRRVSQSEDDLRASEARLRAQRDRLLALLGRVSDLQAELARGAGAIEEAGAALQRQLFEIESAPLWRALFARDRAGALGAELRQALRESGHDVAAFARDAGGRIALHLAIVLALAAALVALRRPVAALELDDAALRGAAKVLARPGSAALLLSLVLAGGLYPPLPPTVRDLLFLAFLVPLLRLLPRLVPDAFPRPLLSLAVIFALDRVASLAPPRTLLARLAVLLVTAAALGLFARALRRGGWVGSVRGAWGTAVRGAAAAAAALLAVSLASNVVGNATLAERLTHATMTSATLAVVLAGVLVALEGALAGLLHLPLLQRRALVARHRALLLRRIATLLRIAAVALWAARTARELGIEGVVAGALASVLGLRLKVGGLDVSLGNVAAFAVTLLLGLAAARLVRFLLDEGVFAEVALPRGISAAVSTTVQYAVVVVAFSWAVLASGMEMSRFSVLIGALGVGIGFGLQNVVNNFVSGLILLYERPVQVRDVVEVAGVAGEVTRIGVRSSTLRTFAGAEVIVPNATLISTEVTNWTLSDRRRRIDLAVGVAYGAEPRRVIELLLAAVRGREGVLLDPAPAALLLRFGENAVEFALRFWTGDFDRWQVLASDVLIEVHASFGRAGIDIPVPQRDLRIRSLDARAVEAPAAASAGDEAAPERERSGPPAAASGSRR